MSGLTIDTTAKPAHKTTLTATQVKNLIQQVYDINPDDDNHTQYTQIREIVAQMEHKFENMYDAMEIDMLKLTLDAVLDRKKRGSKPHELVNVIIKILERVTNTRGGGKRRKTRRRRCRQQN